MTSLIAMSTLFTSSLAILELSSCRLPRQAGIILSQSLPACISLRHLLLADNNIRDGGLRAIADALKLPNASSDKAVVVVLGQKDLSVPMLEHLDISRNGITSTGFTSLMQIPLRRMSVKFNAIASGVGSLLMNNTSTLETLCLQGNPLSEDGKLELVRSLFRRRDKTGKSTLRVLDLRGCGFNCSDGLDLLQRSFLQAATANQQCPLHKLYLDDKVSPTDENLDDQRFRDDCKYLKEMATAKFPSLCLLFESDANMEIFPGPIQQSKPESSKRNINDKVSSTNVEAFVSTLGLTSELEAVAMETKTRVNDTLSSVAKLPVSGRALRSEYTRTDESVILHPGVSDQLSKPAAIVQAHHLQTSSIASSSTMRVEAVAPLPVQHIDVEYVISKTIECMSLNFEMRLGQFLSRMETQQQERVCQ
ncbi:hypothetical protein PHMEG_00014036 [Phytophthora megakarya]|uniref:Uncharacterized protein n=1 Tax=Phytophthora megakarya TaxID=4795 RepID=A0A225W7D6_9STRA|nr:hypothetical protein PHMEG_00014036 [Phytophthora megakarya]